MTTARSLIVDLEAPGFTRCISRCGRRAWLCGIDPYDDKFYEHRREWVEVRLLELAEIFAVGIYAFAVMSNHVHVVLRIDPSTATLWTDEDGAIPWVRLFPATVNREVDALAFRTKQQILLGTVVVSSAICYPLPALVALVMSVNRRMDYCRHPAGPSEDSVMSKRSLFPAGVECCHSNPARIRRSPVASAAILALASFLLPFGCAAGDLPDPIYIHGFEAGCGTLLFVESFSNGNAAEWPAPWIELANSADVADVTAGDGRLRPVISGYSLARMATPIATRDVDVLFSMVMEDATSQGVGFYVRQNGGHLHLTVPSGQGYAIFIEGTFRGMPGFGLWRELDGNESQLLHSGASVASPQSGIRYRVRFRVYQIDAASTRLQGRFWPATDPEPTAWQVELLDMTPALQAISGGIAVDSWNVVTSPAMITAHTRVDDIEVRALCSVAGMAPTVR